MKSFKLLIQFIGIFFLVFVGLIIMPAVSIGIQKESYIKNLIEIKEKDSSAFMEGFAGISGFTYQKTPAYTIKHTTSTLTVDITAYYIASTGKPSGIDGIAFIIDDVKLYNQDYESLSIVTTYPKEIKLPDGTTSTKDTSVIKKGALVPVAIISDYHGSELVAFNQITFNFHDEQNQIIPIISFGPDNANIHYALDDVPFNLSTYGISKHINDKTNIPTDIEKSQHDLFYEKVTISMFYPNFWVGFGFIAGYILIALAFVYFCYIGPLLKVRKKEKALLKEKTE